MVVPKFYRLSSPSTRLLLLEFEHTGSTEISGRDGHSSLLSGPFYGRENLPLCLTVAALHVGQPFRRARKIFFVLAEKKDRQS